MIKYLPLLFLLIACGNEKDAAQAVKEIEKQSYTCTFKSKQYAGGSWVTGPKFTSFYDCTNDETGEVCSANITTGETEGSTTCNNFDWSILEDL